MSESEEKLTGEPVTGRAADWASTAMSVPLIWPKTTAISALTLVVLVVGAVVYQATRPAVPPPPPLDMARIAEFEAQVQAADRSLRTQSPTATPPDSSRLRGLFDAVANPRPKEGNSP
jgi:hypothetical protein